MADKETQELTQPGDGGSKGLTSIFNLTPRSLTEAMDFSKLMAKSEVVPKEYIGKPANILIAVQKGMELGLTPLMALDSIAVINGRATLWGDAVLGIIRRSGTMDEAYGNGGIIERAPDEALAQKEGSCTVKRKGHEPLTRKFSEADAHTAKLIERGGPESPWTKYRGRMLQMRARSWALRDAFGDVLKGLYLREEEEDRIIDTEATILPPRVKEGEVDKFLSETGGGIKNPQTMTGGASSAAPASANETKHWKGVLEKMTKSPTKNPKVFRYTLVGKDGTQFQTIKNEIVDKAKPFASSGELVAISFTTGQYGNDILELQAGVQPPADEEIPTDSDEPGSTG